MRVVEELKHLSCELWRPSMLRGRELWPTEAQEAQGHLVQVEGVPCRALWR